MISTAGYTIGIAFRIFGCLRGCAATTARGDDDIRDDLRTALGSSTLLFKVNEVI